MSPNVSDDADGEIDRTSPPGAPRWVQAVGISALVLLLLFVGLHLTGHMPMHTPPASVAEHSLQAP